MTAQEQAELITAYDGAIAQFTFCVDALQRQKERALEGHYPTEGAADVLDGLKEEAAALMQLIDDLAG